MYEGLTDVMQHVAFAVNACREPVNSGCMHQLLALQLPAAAQSAAGRPDYQCVYGEANDQLEGPLGAVLRLCAALQYGCGMLLDYTTVVTGDRVQQLSQQQADSLAASGLLPALGAACSCTAAALHEQEHSSTHGNTYAEEAAHVLLWLIVVLVFAWPSRMFTGPSALLVAMHPAVTLAATVLRVCRTRLQSAAALLGAARNSATSTRDAQCHAYSATAPKSSMHQSAGHSTAGAHTSANSSSSFSGALQNARCAAVKLASKMASIMQEVNTGEQLAHPQANQLAVSADLLLMLAAVLGIVGHWLHQQQKGRSSVSIAEAARSSSTAGGSSSSSSGTGSRQQRRQQQRQQQSSSGMASVCLPSTSHRWRSRD